MKFLILLLIIPALSCGSKKPILKPVSKTIKEVICLAAKEKNVPCRIIYPIAMTESDLRSIDSEVDLDSAGIFQIRISTAEYLFNKAYGVKRKFTKQEFNDNIKLSSELAVLVYLNCKRAMSISARQIRVREIICFNRGPSGTWEAVNWYGNLKVLPYWKRYEKYWVEFKQMEMMK